jgi:hypothetical protein
MIDNQQRRPRRRQDESAAPLATNQTSTQVQPPRRALVPAISVPLPDQRKRCRLKVGARGLLAFVRGAARPARSQWRRLTKESPQRRPGALSGCHGPMHRSTKTRTTASSRPCDRRPARDRVGDPRRCSRWGCNSGPERTPAYEAIVGAGRHPSLLSGVSDRQLPVDGAVRMPRFRQSRRLRGRDCRRPPNCVLLTTGGW